MRSVKLIKRHERTSRPRLATVKLVTGPIKWSKSVRSWVVEFQERDHTVLLPAFDDLFKDVETHPNTPSE